MTIRFRLEHIKNKANLTENFETRIFDLFFSENLSQYSNARKFRYHYTFYDLRNAKQQLMKTLKKTSIPGVYEIEMFHAGDEPGSFTKSFHRQIS